jgi:hypothetical protein
MANPQKTQHANLRNPNVDASIQIYGGEGGCEMKRLQGSTWIMAVTLSAAQAGFSASNPNVAGIPAQVVITARPAPGAGPTENLEARDLTALEGTTPVPVSSLRRLASDLGDLQLFVFLDDSTRAASLGTHIPELRSFLETLPGATDIAVGYMRNGTFALAESFTTDHQKAASAVRLPEAMPGVNGSPYFALSDLVKHWPSKQLTGRRAVLMLTDGVDRYYDTAIMDDPYVDASIHDAVKEGVTVYSIYLRGAGSNGRGDWVTNFAQGRLNEVSQATGGYAYFENFSDPVTISPFLNDFRDRLENQYLVTIQALDRQGFQAVKLRTEIPGLKIDGPTHIYVR